MKTKPPKAPARTEASVLKGCLRVLALKGIPHWRNNTGAARMGDRYVRFGTKGGSDVLAILPGPGRLMAIEVKRPGGKPTEDQLAFLAAVRDAGGVALVVDDELALAREIDRLLEDIDDRSQS